MNCYVLNDKPPSAVLESWDGDYTVPAGTVVINATSCLADAERSSRWISIRLRRRWWWPM